MSEKRHGFGHTPAKISRQIEQNLLIYPEEI